jgi:glycogen debranching enzyme
VKWTNDVQLFLELEENIMQALLWMDRYGDLDGDGFIEFIRRSPGGRSNQYWKDSWDSLRHRDGSIPEPPMTTVETQAYAFYAKRRLGSMLQEMGRVEEGAELLRQSEQMGNASRRRIGTRRSSSMSWAWMAARSRSG